MSEAPANASALRHGGAQLRGIVVDTYKADFREADGFVGDRVSRRAFATLVENWRERLRNSGQDDPLGKIPAKELKKKKLAKVLLDGKPEAAALIHSAIEEFEQELATVIRRFLRLKEWRETQTILIGGGFRASRLGELAIGRAGLLLKTEGLDIIFRSSPFVVIRMRRVWSDACSLRQAGSPLGTTASWPLISAAPTSGRALSSSTLRRPRTSPRPLTTNPVVTRQSKNSLTCSAG